MCTSVQLAMLQGKIDLTYKDQANLENSQIIVTAPPILLLPSLPPHRVLSTCQSTSRRRRMTTSGQSCPSWSTATRYPYSGIAQPAPAPAPAPAHVLNLSGDYLLANACVSLASLRYCTCTRLLHPQHWRNLDRAEPIRAAFSPPK